MQDCGKRDRGRGRTPHGMAPGSGVFKSTDNGKTWRQLRGGLPENIIQANLAVAPSNPNRVFASIALSPGLAIYRSDDAGETWTRITTDPRPAGRIGGGDLAVLRVDPKNPEIVYSASIVLEVRGRRQDLDRFPRCAGRR